MDSISELKLFLLIFKLQSPENTDSEKVSLIIQIISFVRSVDLHLKPNPESHDSHFKSLVTQAISVFDSLDLKSQPEPLSKLVSLIYQKLYLLNSTDSDFEPMLESESEIMSLFAETWSLEPEPELISIINQIRSLFEFTDSEQESEFMSIDHSTTDSEQDSEFMHAESFTDSQWWEPEFMDVDSFLEWEPEFMYVDSCSNSEYQWDSEFRYIDSSMDSDEESEFMSVGSFTDSELISLISQIRYFPTSMEESDMSEWMLIRQLVSLVSSLDLDLQPKPKSVAISLISQVIHVANSIPDSAPEWELISLVTQFIPLIRSVDPEQEPPEEVILHMAHVGSHFHSMNPDSELGLLITQLLNLSHQEDTKPEAEWEPGQFISLSPQLKVELAQGKFHVKGKIERKSKEKGKCQFENQQKVYLAKGEDATHFRCKDCNGEDHDECDLAPIQVKHPLHPKHSLQLVLQKSLRLQTRKCFCCDEDLQKFFYYCSACDYAMNIACAEKPPVLFMDHPEWHEHTLYLFPRRAFLTCNVCALADESSPIYMCPPCDFVVHLKCIKLPRVIMISRHPHRISFTPYFNHGEWSCGVCRKGIDNDYGGYSCIKEGCSYAAHSRCATQTNVWDGIELEGVPEDIEEEEIKPFVTISKGIIQHFSHDYEHHHLRLDENMGRDYDDTMQCQACITPIYTGNFYSCEKCDFILHEKCANLSLRIHHPIHPHVLSLVGRSDNGTNDENKCSACPWWCTTGFFYECSKGCRFKLHVQCATISEPLVHGSHNHPLYLTSKPGEERVCGVCEKQPYYCTETFNCIKDCNFALCFKCATLPQEVRYKHDKHMLTLSYGKETSTMTSWCEACEKKIKPKRRFYKCDEYCCVTLHIECVIGEDLYLKPGSSWLSSNGKVGVLPNSRLLSRPICSYCEERCPHNTVVERSGLIFCSINCNWRFGK